MKTIFTVRDAIKERLAFDAKMHARFDAQERHQAEIDSILSANPQIGILMRKGKPCYYVNQGGAAIVAKHPLQLIEACQ